ncbi:MAG TPA: hypothetical protein VGP82_08150 [Ktedonobacterales bacterium]|jgi:hypothetical protein|nr:hypothetical protein [Ktedonobacterales bacterium]
MPIIIASRRTSLEKLHARYGPDMSIYDVTSRGPEPWVRFSPFYPHGGIPVPFSPGVVSMSVEGIWQALKVFERAGVDRSRFTISTMRGLKRSARTYGRVLGHQTGIAGEHLLSYVEARRLIYLPSYRWVLECRVADLIEKLKRAVEHQTVVLLDYETNCDVDDIRRPLSHACLIARFAEGTWPE